MNTLATALAGGVLIGLAATLLWRGTGHAAGISGIVAGLVSGDRVWRLAFTLGLLAGGVLLLAVSPDVFGTASHRSLPMLAVAGVLVGYGTRLGGGCTSGHGICGISRGSGRSVGATAVFLTVGVVVATLVGRLTAGAA